MNFDSFNKQAVNNYYSPRQFRHQNQSSYCKPLNNINNILAYNQTHHTQNLLVGNKENQQSATSLTSASNLNKAKTTPTINSNEIIDTAQRILSKRQNNMDAGQNENSNSSLVKNMKSKFEDPSAAKNCTSNVTIQLTPKSIIKKFELMTRDNQQK